MVSTETLLHVDPATGQPQPIGLGWLDDSMTMNGPTEEDPNYIADTGATAANMASQVAAYRASMNALIAKVIPMGGFFWQLMDSGGAKLNTGLNQTVNASTCLAHLRSVCAPQPPNWSRFQLYNLPNGGFGASRQSFTDYTAEFLLTRGPYALIGYSWFGCTDGDRQNPRAPEWDEDFGTPVAPCEETIPGASGIFIRNWTHATVSWDCAAQHGSIVRK